MAQLENQTSQCLAIHQRQSIGININQLCVSIKGGSKACCHPHTMPLVRGGNSFHTKWLLIQPPNSKALRYMSVREPKQAQENMRAHTHDMGNKHMASYGPPLSLSLSLERSSDDLWQRLLNDVELLDRPERVDSPRHAVTGRSDLPRNAIRWHLTAHVATHPPPLLHRGSRATLPAPKRPPRCGPRAVRAWKRPRGGPASVGLTGVEPVEDCSMCSS